jgi:hypothetical protein
VYFFFGSISIGGGAEYCFAMCPPVSKVVAIVHEIAFPIT